MEKINKMCKLSHMVRGKYISLFFIGLMTLGSIGWSQFVEINVDLDMRRISEGDRQLLNTLREDIEQYYLYTQFSPEVIDLGMVINIHLVLESVTHGGNQTTINAQAIFTNKLDQYFYAKGVQFPYSRGRKMYYTTSFDPLASFLDYYAFMFIASELDTWDYMGGTTFFNKAIEFDTKAIYLKNHIDMNMLRITNTGYIFSFFPIISEEKLTLISGPNEQSYRKSDLPKDKRELKKKRNSVCCILFF